MNLTLGFSPCPNDTFMFEAIINHRIDLEGIKFNVSIDDVSQLNKWSFDGRLDVTKLSFNGFKYCVKNYIIRWRICNWKKLWTFVNQKTQNKINITKFYSYSRKIYYKICY